MSSNNSSDADDYDNDYEDEDELSVHDFSFGESTIHPSFERDVQLFRQHFPKETIISSLYDDLAELDIEMTVDLGFIARSVLEAWGLNPELPLTLRLKLRSSVYCFDDGYSKLDVYQTVSGKETTVFIQLKKIGQSFSRWYFSQQNQQPKETEKSADNGCLKKDKGYLVELCTKMHQRLKTLNDYCPLCDRPHGSTSMLKPTVCSHPLCIFSSQTMGVMCLLTEAIQTQPQVVNLLIAFTLTASLSPRHKLILKPFPDLLDPVTNECVFTNDKAGISMLRVAVNILHNFKFSSTATEWELKEKLNEQFKYTYSLLRWLISSNRSHILYIPEPKQVPDMYTRSQFVMRNSPPAEDEQFRVLAQKHGSCFAFHGSPIENWHSIVRQGLFVCTGSELQIHGAKLGAGIYVTPFLDVALGYAGYHTKITPKQINDEQVVEPKDWSTPSFCVALCEVITGPGLKRKDIQRWLVADSRHICTRFFFVYPNRPLKNCSVQSNTKEFEDSIKTILSDI